MVRDFEIFEASDFYDVVKIVGKHIEHPSFQPLRIVVQAWDKTITGKQRRWYFGSIIRPIAKAAREAGVTKENGRPFTVNEFHEYFKYKYDFYDYNEFNGEIMKTPKSMSYSANCRNTEFGDHCEKIIAWAADEDNMGIEVGLCGEEFLKGGNDDSSK